MVTKSRLTRASVWSGSSRPRITRRESATTRRQAHQAYEADQAGGAEGADHRNAPEQIDPILAKEAPPKWSRAKPSKREIDRKEYAETEVHPAHGVARRRALIELNIHDDHEERQDGEHHDHAIPPERHPGLYVDRLEALRHGAECAIDLTLRAVVGTLPAYGTLSAPLAGALGGRRSRPSRQR